LLAVAGLPPGGEVAHEDRTKQWRPARRRGDGGIQPQGAHPRLSALAACPAGSRRGAGRVRTRRREQRRHQRSDRRAVPGGDRVGR
jgi:hypothetical protein